MNENLIPQDLCTRCGACFAADRAKILREDERGFPSLVRRDPDEEQRLKKVCTGANWNYRELLDYVHGKNHSYAPMSPDVGKLLEVKIAYSSDEALRESGQSGGISISLLRAGIRMGIFDRALAVRRGSRAKGDNPFAAIPYIIRGEDNLMEAAGSKYAICPSLKLLEQLNQEAEAGYAMTLLPCQTAGYHQLTRTEGVHLKEKCKLIIGPYCGLNMEWEVGAALARASGLDPDEVDCFGNRMGSFPGETTFVMKDGKLHHVDRTAHRALYRMYSPIRCYTCTDYGNELADLTIADAFLRGEETTWKYPKGAGFVIARTPRGLDFLKRAVKEGHLVIEDFDVEVFKQRWVPSFEHRKVRGHIRMELQRERGEPTPTVDYSIPKIDKSRFYEDRVELGLVRLFARDCIRKPFLRWWLRAASPKATKLEKRAFVFLKYHLFTHQTESILKPKRIFRGLVKSVKRG